VGGDVDRFLAEDWGRQARPWPGADRGAFADLLTLDDVDRAVTTAGLRRPFVRLVRDGQPVPAHTYTKGARVGGAAVADLADPGRLLAAFDGGATLVLQSMQRWWPPLARFCRDLELVLTHPIQANAYLTPAGSVGLAPHHDTHDVFVLQLHGAKQWRVAAPSVEAPLARHRSTAAEARARPVLFDTELTPGDAMYLPRGVVHSAEAQRGASLHLTVGVLALTGHDVVRRVADAAADVPELRRALPPGWADDRASARAAVASALASLAAWVGSVDPDELAQQLADTFWSDRAPLLEGQLRQLEQLPVQALDDAAVVRPRPGVVARPHLAGEQLVLTLGDRTLTLPAACEPAVTRLLAGPARVGELPGPLDGPSRAVLARRLVREGVLVTDVPAAGSTGAGCP
jgi:hypothetical protein